MEPLNGNGYFKYIRKLTLSAPKRKRENDRLDPEKGFPVGRRLISVFISEN